MIGLQKTFKLGQSFTQSITQSIAIKPGRIVGLARTWETVFSQCGGEPWMCFSDHGAKSPFCLSIESVREYVFFTFAKSSLRVKVECLALEPLIF